MNSTAASTSSTVPMRNLSARPHRGVIDIAVQINRFCRVRAEYRGLEGRAASGRVSD
jgi:hypothetical protein